MIRHLSGTIIAKEEEQVVLDVHGVGYAVAVPRSLRDACAVGISATFFTYLQVGEIVLSLYGFANQSDLAFFELLLDVSGIGPKTALHIMDKAAAHDLQQAIFEKDVTRLQSYGIGKKFAERMTVELSKKMEKMGVGLAVGSAVPVHADVVSALQGLGFYEPDVREVLRAIPKNVIGADEQIKWALPQLGKRK